MLIASAVEDVLKVNMPVAAKGAVAESKPLEAAQRWENMTEHKKVIEKGPPEEIPKPPAGKFPIPSNGIVGLLNRQGSKTRLTFKTGEDTLVISTAERTQ